MLLEVDNVRKVYEGVDGSDGVEVLKGVSFELGEGESVAVVGPSGSGKSTLLNIVGALDAATGGRVMFGGRELGELSDKELSLIRNHEIGFVFQSHHLLPQCTALENVLVPTLACGGLKGKARKRAAERGRGLLERVGLSQRLGYRPGQLSGGECQRVAVVRALINEPGLVLADEPTGALDHRNAVELMELLVELNREEGVGMIVVTHAVELADELGKVVELRDGKLIDGGGERGVMS